MKNKLFKGAVAGAAGVALLLGGAGTFALWQDNATIGTEGRIDAGHLHFMNANMTGEWFLNGDTEPLDIADLDDLYVVPGDVLEYKTSNVGIIAHGTNLVAELGFDFGSMVTPGGGTAADQLAELMRPTFYVDGEQAVPSGAGTATFTIDEDNHTVNTMDEFTIGSLVVRFEFPNTEPLGTTAQGGILNIADFHLTLQQVPHADHTP